MATNNSINSTLATPFTVGATSVTSTGTQLNLLNAMTVVPFNKIASQAFTASSGTYTPTTGMVYCIVEAWGGGGAGGGCTSTTSNSSAGGGGGAGSYSRRILTAAQIGASEAYAIGAGGTPGTAGNNAGGNGADTTLGSTLVVGKGGSGGGGGAAGSQGAGGAGGIAGTGDLTGIGNNGLNGLTTAAVSTEFVLSGVGASTILGPGANTGSQQVSTTGSGATANTGAGGGGAVSWNGASTPNRAGGAGGSGYMIITEFLSA